MPRCSSECAHDARTHEHVAHCTDRSGASGADPGDRACAWADADAHLSEVPEGPGRSDEEGISEM